jgi:hypothetical protein
MSPTDNERRKLSRLADAIIEDIVSTSDTDILAEVDIASIEQARVILVEAKANVSSRLLVDAKAQLDAWRSAQSRRRTSGGPGAAQDTFEKFRREDPAFNQHMTIAARKGKAPTDKDKEGLDEDWADLQQLEDRGESE